jgi:hypothetical protein
MSVYSPGQIMRYEPCACDRAGIPPAWLRDKIADQKFTGGYNVKRANQCPGCFQFRSVNRACGC